MMMEDSMLTERKRSRIGDVMNWRWLTLTPLSLMLLLLALAMWGAPAHAAQSDVQPRAQRDVQAEPLESIGPLPVPVLRIGVEDSWPPYADAQGRGLSTNIVQAAFAAIGLQVIIEAKPYARVLRDLEAGLLDAGYNITRQASTENRFVFGSEPILTATVSFYYSPTAIHEYHSVTDVPTGTSIASIIDYEYGDLFESQRHRYQEYKVMRQSQIILMLMAKRVDAGVLYDRVAEYTLDMMDLPESSLVRGARIHTSDVYVAFSRQNPRSQEYAALLDQGLRTIRENGVYDQLIQRPWQHLE